MCPERLTVGPGRSGTKGTGNKMKPLPIGKMQIEVYNIEESPLHQIVKKLIYKKILDLEPYNFNYVSDSTGDLAKKILKCIKGKTLSEAKELVFVIKNEMNPFRRLH